MPFQVMAYSEIVRTGAIVTLVSAPGRMESKDPSDGSFVNDRSAEPLILGRPTSEY